MKTAPTDDLNLLREWREPIPPSRIMAAVIGVILYHAVAFTAFVAAVNAPGGRVLTDARLDLHRAVPLYIPRDLTQRDPNRGKVTHDLDVRSGGPSVPVPQAPRFRPSEPAPLPIPAIPAPSEPPKVDAAVIPPPLPASPGNLPPVALPPADKPTDKPTEKVDKPKLTFESVGAGGTTPRIGVNPNVKLPQIASTIEEALRTPAAAQPPQPSPGGGIVIGDLDDATRLSSPNQAPSSGPVRSNLQLLSDPEGVDFKPYLVQVLTAVRVNWLSVIPESARFGRRGRVLVQFIINRRGGVPKLVIAESSGTAAFDRAAVAGISASYPFPALPRAFKGDEIRLQLAFTYNQAAR